MRQMHDGAYGAADDIVDYILGITFEIWEEGRVDLIDQYYTADTVVFALDGITHGSAAVIAGTNATLAAFPDRRLLGDDVITAGNAHNGYSSHRVLSPMTNSGDSAFGAATGRAVRIMNMADCVVQDGAITTEWLARDNLALIRQLGFDANEAALAVASKLGADVRDWFASEAGRLAKANDAESKNTRSATDARRLLDALWVSGQSERIDAAYAPYAVLHRSPVETLSGRRKIAQHFADLRGAFTCSATSVDHECAQPGGDRVENTAVRWSVGAKHTGDYFGIAATGREVYIMGVTHRRLVSGRIAIEWTVFDSLGVMAQLL